jgi:hypothetical protein
MPAIAAVAVMRSLLSPVKLVMSQFQLGREKSPIKHTVYSGSCEQVRSRTERLHTQVPPLSVSIEDFLVSEDLTARDETYIDSDDVGHREERG